MEEIKKSNNSSITKGSSKGTTIMEKMNRETKLKRFKATTHQKGIFAAFKQGGFKIFSHDFENKSRKIRFLREVRPSILGLIGFICLMSMLDNRKLLIAAYQRYRKLII